jgi:AcrR family transcriptional regulator
MSGSSAPKKTAPNGRSTLRDAQKRFTRNRLLDASLEAFNEVGYASATVDQIVASAGASRATFYLHFSGKPEVLQELTEGHQHQARTIGLYESVPTHGADRADVRAWISQLITHIENDPFISIYDQAASVDRGVAQHYEQTMNRVASIIVEHISPPPPTAAIVSVQLRLLLVQLQRISYFRLVGEWELDREELIDGLTLLWHGVISPRED